jgi:hypothetical protein
MFRSWEAVSPSQPARSQDEIRRRRQGEHPEVLEDPHRPFHVGRRGNHDEGLRAEQSPQDLRLLQGVPGPLLDDCIPGGDADLPGHIAHDPGVGHRVQGQAAA